MDMGMCVGVGVGVGVGVVVQETGEAEESEEENGLLHCSADTTSGNSHVRGRRGGKSGMGDG